MKEITSIYTDLGITACIVIVILFLGLKYIPKWLDLRLERAKEKDYMMDSFKSVIENNSKVIDNNSQVIKLNSETIKAYGDYAAKLENQVAGLSGDIQVLDGLIKETKMDIEILKDRGK